MLTCLIFFQVQRMATCLRQAQCHPLFKFLYTPLFKEAVKFFFLQLTEKAKSVVQERRCKKKLFCVDVLLSELRRILESCNLLWRHLLYIAIVMVIAFIVEVKR